MTKRYGRSKQVSVTWRAVPMLKPNADAITGGRATSPGSTSSPSLASLLQAEDASEKESGAADQLDGLNAPIASWPDDVRPKMQRSIHPYAEIFPILSAEELNVLADDIAVRGLLDPIVLHDGQILDGRCRYLACQIAGVEPRYETYVGDDPLGYVVSRNLHRRHLTASQRALVAASLSDLNVGANQHTSSEGVPIGIAAALMKVSPRSVARAKQLVRLGPSELVQAVAAGKIAVSAATLQLGQELDRVADREDGLSVPETVTAVDGAGSVASGTEVGVGKSIEIGIKVSEDRQTSAPQSPVLPQSAQEPAKLAEATAEDVEPGWLWDRFIPNSAVTAIIGSMASPVTLVPIRIAATVTVGGDWPNYHRASRGRVVWLTRHADFERVMFNHFQAAEVRWSEVDVLPPELDNFNLPTYDMARDLDRLGQLVSNKDDVRLVIVDSFPLYLGCGDIEGTIRNFSIAFGALRKIATHSSAAVIVLCPLPFRKGHKSITLALRAFAAAKELNTLIIVEGNGSGGTVTPAKDPNIDVRRYLFRVNFPCGPSGPTIVWDNERCVP
ncbi:MAG: AAA family ATPase [Xanthobacteraceae bacterium]